MRVALTGTPGTGKTTVANAVESDLTVVDLGEIIERERLVESYDPVRQTDVVDVDAIEATLADRDNILIESHLAHRLSVDRVIVLRCHPAELERRLRERGTAERSVTENADAEALDVVLAEAVERHGRENVYEIDTTERSVAEVVDSVEDVLSGKREPAVGLVDFTGYL